MSAFPPVVRATIDGHRVIAVRCSNVPGKPWLVFDIDKGWTTSRADTDLECKEPMSVNRSGIQS